MVYEPGSIDLKQLEPKRLKNFHRLWSTITAVVSAWVIWVGEKFDRQEQDCTFQLFVFFSDGYDVFLMKLVEQTNIKIISIE